MIKNLLLIKSFNILKLLLVKRTVLNKKEHALSFRSIVNYDSGAFNVQIALIVFS